MWPSLVLASMLCVVAEGSQTGGPTAPDSAPGAPAGSYALSAFESVNLFNGNLQVALPLDEVRGRGDARHTIVLPIGTRWDLVTVGPVPNGPIYFVGDAWSVAFWHYGPGIVTGITEQVGAGTCGNQVFENQTRIVFRDSEGTEHEFRDVLTEGQPRCPSPFGYFNRGSVFRTFDGSASTFVSDTDISDNLITEALMPMSGSLFLRDGRRYRVDNGLITSLQDRNGNRLDFVYESSPPPVDPGTPDLGLPAPWFRRLASVQDSLGRVVTITYATAGAPYDTIDFAGTGGAPRTVRVHRGPMSSAMFPGDNVVTYGQLFPEIDLGFNPGEEGTLLYDPRVATAVTLPDGRQYRFQYNRYGELMKIELPTGGDIQYTHGAGMAGAPPSGTWLPRIYRRVRSRTVHDGAGGPPQTTLFSQENSTDIQVTIDETHLDGGVVARRDRHFFARDNPASWKVGREERTEMYDGAGALLRRVTHTWAQRAPVPWCTDQARACPANDPRITRTETTLESSGLVGRQDFEYDSYNNVTRVREYDYGLPGLPGTIGPLLRDTQRSYLTANSRGVYDSEPVHVRDAVSQELVLGGDGRVVSWTCHEYDQTPVLDRPGIIGHDPGHGTDFFLRGNVTSVRRARGDFGCDLTLASNAYDIAGNVVTSSDAKGNQTQLFYDDRFGFPDGEADSNAGGPFGPTFAFVTRVTNALGHVSRTQYDYRTGMPVDMADVNDIVTSTRYDDALDRPTEVTAAANTLHKSQTRFEYDDVGHAITTTRDLSTFGDGAVRSQTTYDGLGRTTLVRRFEDTSETQTATQYDAFGRVRQVTNPYRPGDLVGTTTTEYDALDRVTRVTAPDGAQTLTSYDANRMTVTDAAGNMRQSVSDAIGRPRSVTEDPQGSALVTLYEHDAVGNVTKVTQGQQVRTFQYDRLARMQSSTNPESGTATYDYDDNGNLVTKTDGRGITVNASYDALDRLLQQTYSDGTPAVSFAYDTASGGTGRPASISSSVSTSRFQAYDALGNVTQYAQQTGGRTYAMSYEYNRAGLVTTATYPSGRRIDTTYDQAGRISGLRGTFQQQQRDFIRPGSIAYTAHGDIAGMDYGNGVHTATSFNTRLQPVGITAGPTDAPLLGLEYGYGTTDNNGNVLSQTITAGPLRFQQSYGYDRLNRLTQAIESGSWSQTYLYDRFGNRAVQPGSYLPNPAQTIQSLAQFDPSTNRVSMPGAAYDAAGNLKQDWVGRGFDYDAENRQVRFATASDSAAYAYDGSGRRVSKTDDGAITTFAYDAGGRLAAEHGPSESREYIYAGDRLIAAVKMAPSTTPTPIVAVTPASVPLNAAQMQQFVGTCTLSGAPCAQAVRWGASVGTIDGNGLYQAPATVDTTTTATITACWAFAPEVCALAQATITGTHPSVRIHVDPATAVSYQTPVWLTAIPENLVLPLTYEWHRGSSNAVVGGDVIYAFVAVADDTFQVVVTDAQGTRATSPMVTVSVTCATSQPSVGILAYPIGRHIARGDSVWLTANGTGMDLGYQWFEGGVGGIPAGSTRAIMPFPMHDTTYTVQVTDSCGHHAEASVEIRVCVPTIVAPPQSVVLAPGTTTTLSVTASPAQPGQPVTYQWYRGFWGQQLPAAIAGATSAQLVVSAADADQYWVVVNGCDDGPYGVTSAIATVTTCAPPQVVSAIPQLNVTAGQSVSPSVSASGRNLSYTWYRGPTGDTSQPVPNATGPYVTFVASSDEKYWVRVASDGVCTTDSQTFFVTICPTITSVSVDSTVVMPGTSATVSVAATGPTPPTYHWYQGNAFDTTHPVGTNSSTLVTPPLAANTSFWAAVTRGYCTVNSDTVEINLCEGPTATWLSLGRPLRVSEPYTLAINASPGPADGSEVSWYQGTSGDVAHSQFLSGPTGYTSYMVFPSQTTSYWARVRNGICYGDTPTLTLNVCVPVITTQPASVMTNSGQPATLSVAANTTGLTYQWFVGAAGDVSNPVAGATGATLSVTPTSDTTYWVRVTGSCGQSVDSTAATVTVCRPPVVVSQTPSQWLARGQSVPLSVNATGTNLTYQWYAGTSGDTSAPIAGATSATLAVAPPNTTSYWVRVTGTCGSVNGATITISVCAPPSIVAPPVSTNVFSGTSATLAVSASEATTAPLSYQWYRGASGVLSTPVGTNASTFTTPPLTAATDYWVRVSCGTCHPADSDTATVGMCAYPQTIAGPPDVQLALGQTATLAGVPNGGANGYNWYLGNSGDTSHPLYLVGSSITVTPSVTTQYWVQVQNGGCVSNSTTTTVSVCIPTITQQPASVTINSGQPATLSVAANTAGLTYQWYTGASGNTASPVAGATGPTLTVTPTADTSYWVRVTGSCGQSVNSTAATVTVCRPPAIVSQTPGQWLTRGQSLPLSVTATGTNLTYQWYTGASGDTSAPIAGATSATLAVAPPNTTQYWVRVSGMCGSVNGATITVSVCLSPSIVAPPASTNVFSGTSATLAVTATEATTAPLSYQWYRGASGVLSTPVGTNASTFTTPPLTAATDYWVRVSCGTCNPADSDTATVGMCAYPQTIAGPPDVQIALGQSATLAGVPSGGANGYNWYLGNSGDTSHPLYLVGSSITVTPSVTTQYWVQVQNGGCVSNSTTTTVSVCIPTITQQPASVTINGGQSTTLSVAANTAGTTYQWFVGPSGNTASPIAGATAPALTVSPSSTTSYWVRVTGACGRTADSAAATVTVCAPPAIVTQPSNALPVYRLMQSSLSVNASGTGLTYRWYQGASGDTSVPLNATTSTLMTTVYDTYSYWVRVSGSCGSVDSAAALMSVYPQITQQPLDASVNPGSTTTLSVTALGNSLTYQWYQNDYAHPVGTNSSTFVTPPLSAATSYFVVVTSGTASVPSNAVTVTMCDGPGFWSWTQAYGGGCYYIGVTLGDPEAGATFYWYLGSSGDTSHPLGPGNYYMWVCPTPGAKYWIRVSNDTCHADSATWSF